MSGSSGVTSFGSKLSNGRSYPYCGVRYSSHHAGDDLPVHSTNSHLINTLRSGSGRFIETLFHVSGPQRDIRTRNKKPPLSGHGFLPTREQRRHQFASSKARFLNKLDLRAGG